MTDSWVDAYLDRIGAERPARPDGEALRDLHVRHLRTVPFENLSIHLGEDIVLDEDRLVAKVVDRRRGGFCYELGGAFGALLTALGYEVTPLAARVFGDGGPGMGQHRHRLGPRARAHRDLVAGGGREQVGHAGVGDDLAAAGHHQVVGGVLQLAHQVAGDQHGAALSGQ